MSNREKPDLSAEHLTPAQLEAALADARARRAKALASRKAPTDPIPSAPWGQVDSAPVPLIDEFNLGDKPYVRPTPVRPDPPTTEKADDPMPNEQRMTIWLPERELQADDNAESDLALPENMFFEHTEPEPPEEVDDEDLIEEFADEGYKKSLRKLPALVPVLARRAWGTRLDGGWRTPEDSQRLQRRRAALVSGVVSFGLVIGIGIAAPSGRPPAPETVVTVPPTALDQSPLQVGQVTAPLALEPVALQQPVERLATVVPSGSVLPDLPPLDDAVGAIADDDTIAQAVADAVAEALATPLDAPLAEAGPAADEAPDPAIGVAVSPRPMPRPTEDRAAVSGPPRVVILAPNSIAEPDVSAFAEGVANAGFIVPNTGRPGVTVATNHVRFYHPGDRAAAERLAALIGAASRDFTDFTPAPEAGQVELWLAGESVDLRDFRLADGLGAFGLSE